MLRIRATSFLVGFGLASAVGLYQLRQDVSRGNEAIASQVGEVRQLSRLGFDFNQGPCSVQGAELKASLESRISKLEEAMTPKSSGTN
jgi:hypothetical protein